MDQPANQSSIAELLRQASTLSSTAAERAEAGDVEGALAIESQADRLRKAARGAARASVNVEPTADIEVGSRGPSSTLREVTIAALNELGVPSAPRAVADYAAARFGVSIDPRAFAAMRRDEQRSWASSRSQRPAYVVPALEGQRFLPLRGKVALSTWPLERRVIGPWSERADHLRATVNVARQARWLQSGRPDQADGVMRLLDRYAATVVAGGPSGPDAVEAAAEDELQVIGEPDLSWRREVIDRAAAVLDEKSRLWGADLPVVVAGRAG